MARAVVLLTVIIGVLMTAFAWPAVRSSVHDLPIAAAEKLIRDREVCGAIDLSTGTPQVLTASAASAAIAQTLQGVGLMGHHRFRRASAKAATVDTAVEGTYATV